MDLSITTKQLLAAGLDPRSPLQPDFDKKKRKRKKSHAQIPSHDPVAKN